MNLTFRQLADKYADGFSALDAADFEGVTHTDRLRLMEDVNQTDILRLSSDAYTPRAVHPDKDKGKKKSKVARTFRYTMSTQNPVGSFGDVVVVKGWDLRDFKKRGGPFLFGHNSQENRMPLGSMADLAKGAEADFVKGEPVLAGDSQFTEEGINPFNDLAHDMVQAGAMPGGSVGFRIMESRAPTEEELGSIKGLQKYSFVALKSQLIEFSAVPVGMDPDAVKRRSFDGDSSVLDAKLAEYVREGRYDEDLISEFRELMIGAPEARGSSFVSMSTDEEPNQEQGTDTLDTDSKETPQADSSERDVSTNPSAESLSAPPSTLDIEVEELREENSSLRAITERLEVRLAFLEAVLLPESAESGDASVSREIAGDEDNAAPSPSIYDVLLNFSDEELSALVATNPSDPI